jgi:hypothetical protein
MKGVRRVVAVLAWAVAVLPGFGCGETPAASDPDSMPLTPAIWTRTHALDADARGMMEFYGNFTNLSVTSADPSLYRAEYRAGWLQGFLSRDLIVAARDNVIEGAVRETGLPVQLAYDLKWIVEFVLTVNLEYSLEWIRSCPDPSVRQKMTGLLYRLVGIAGGASGAPPAGLRFDGEEPFAPGFFTDDDLRLSFGRDDVTFQDVHFLNASTDLVDLASALLPTGTLSERCSAFIVRTGDDLILAHTTMSPYSLSLPMRLNLDVNGIYLSAQALNPGLLGSFSDFGYNGQGILFNETTVSQQGRPQPKVEALWSFWRAALAEFYADSLDAFFDYISLEDSGTYMNGYQIADVRNRTFGLVEMDEERFVFFRPVPGGGYEVECRPACVDPGYDSTLLAADYVIGFNVPVSREIRESLNYPPEALDKDPVRTTQFLERIHTVRDVATARELISFFDPAFPRSIYSRRDLDGARPQPSGSVDAKVVSASMLLPYLERSGTLEPDFWRGRSDGCWMKFGPPSQEVGPFVWSESAWADWRHDRLPDEMEGSWQMFFSHVR